MVKKPCDGYNYGVNNLGGYDFMTDTVASHSPAMIKSKGKIVSIPNVFASLIYIKIFFLVN